MMFDGCPSVDVDQQYQCSIVHNPSSSWLHTPPAQMPWSIPDQPSVMRFTGDSCTSAGSLGFNNHAICRRARKAPLCPRGFLKRKMEGDWDCFPPAKQQITDEKMAANLSGLHISNNYTTHQFGSSLEVDNKFLPPGESRTDTENLPSLVLCEELRKLTSEPIIPPSLLNKIERPTNALVLWQPPGGTICDKLRMAVQNSSFQSETQTNKLSNCSMEESEEDSDPQPSTSGLNQFTRTTSQNRSIWPEFSDNNNSSNTVDLNLLTQTRPFSDGLPGVSSDDAMMDL